MFRVLLDAAVLNDGRKPDRDRIVVPASGVLLDLGSQSFRRKLHSGIEFPRLAPRDHQLDVRATDVDDEDFLLHRDVCANELLAESELLEEPALLRFRAGRSRRPAFDDLEREKTKQSEPRELEIEPEVFRNLGD